MYVKTSNQIFLKNVRCESYNNSYYYDRFIIKSSKIFGIYFILLK